MEKLRDATFAGIKAASKPNVGYARSPALTEAASIVRYWRAQISSNRNNVGLSCGIRTFALKHSLPTSVLVFESIITKLHDAWKSLRVVQQTAEEERSKWIHEQADALADDMKTTRSVALKQMAREADMRMSFQRMKSISKGEASGAISMVKVPHHEWMYHEVDDVLFHYVKGAFYAHAQESSLDGGDTPFRKHFTRKPLPNQEGCVSGKRHGSR